MAYNAMNRLTSLSRFSDLTGTNAVAGTSYVYDGNQRLTQLSHQKGASTIASYGFTYDAANRITQSSGTDGVQDYSYDDTNQLTAVDHTTIADEAYSYDANGNRTNAGYGTGTNNQLLSDGTHNYTYDGEGNRTKRTEIATGKVTEYVWDYRNRLASVLFKDGAGVVTKTIEYLYDVNNQRIGKKIDGVTTERYVLDRNQISLVFDGAGLQTHRYLYGTQVDQVLADETATGMVWALADREGTVTDLIDNNGVVVNHVTYDSFGKVVSQSNPSVEFRYGYTGREQDEETGLDYYRARYYDAANGRFISEDPLGFGAGDGNLTRYVGNSPTNFRDPSGLEPVKNEAGTVDDFLKLFNATKGKFGTSIGITAAQKLLILSDTNFDILKGRPTPTQVVFKDDRKVKNNRYIYTKYGGWIDMSHFLFYASRAYNHSKDINCPNPFNKTINEGLLQELTDPLTGAPQSSFSYEDLPSDRFGAEFALKYFDPKINQSLGEQIKKYLVRLGATDPQFAPNYKQIPDKESKNPPIAKNYSTIPFFTDYSTP
jgi:RHS repeat-associated protein